ncbi:MAG: tetratricopeptide repeat protein [Anaerolineae bacterium]|uniref:transglycosylase SLT domain-containing protein n=1 Tax=Thermoflexus sp. TaxID=1969742 RepID=UPI0025D8EF17|nr:tetratricopeptide repeat protein [Thermoflexus sp.]MCS7349896.1 tetratricopeptide repeat protein [Thermoflexus sp.]MDW8179342.1 tetratricopeptide repeat protein [Anaerolineae bacterium]
MNPQASRPHRWRWVVMGFALLSLVAFCGRMPRPFSLPSSPSPTPTVTPTATATPSPTPSPTPTPTPTLSPNEWLMRARSAMRIGAFEEAATAYAAALQGPLSAEQAGEAWLGRGRALLAAERPADAAQALGQAPLESLPPEWARSLWALLGDARRQAGDPAGAAEAYAQALASGSPLTVELRMRRALVLREAGRWEAAAAELRAALPLARDRSQEAAIREQLAETLEALQAHPAALEQYQRILAFAQNPAYRALITWRAAEVLLRAGQAQVAYDQLQRLIREAPNTFGAYNALVRLVEAGIPVPDDLRGRINYFAGQCLPAVRAFERWIAAHPEHGDAHYYAALCYRNLGNRNAAHAHLDALIRDHPEAPRWAEGWLEKGRLWIQEGNSKAAVDLWRRFLARFPDHPFVPRLLWEAGRLLERNGAEASAVDFYRQLAEGSPADARAPEAWHRLGVLAYARGDLVTAASAWEALRNRYPGSPWALTARFWLGKVAIARGDRARAEAEWQAVATQAAGRFLGERARMLLNGQDSLEGGPVPAFPDPEAGREEAEAWLLSRLGITDTTVLQNPRVLSDPAWLAGEEAWRMGWVEEARQLWTGVRQRLDEDPLALYQLALAFRAQGADALSLQAAARLLARLGVRPQEAPPFLARLAYPTPYPEQVLAEAQRYQLDPLLLYALIRQESLFDPYAVSSAQARGLMQIIPPTAQAIAGALGQPYRETWLYRPQVNITFGVYYLARQRDRFGGNLWVALAAYNGGPGNAARWWEAARGDVDLFYERITFEETRRYLERILEHLSVYRSLYASHSDK